MAKVQLQNGRILEFAGNPTPEDIDFAVKQMGAAPSPSSQQMAQQAASMPQGGVPQIPVNPGMGYGMNTMGAINANAMLAPEANKAAIDANIELQKNQMNIGNEAQKAAAVKEAAIPGTVKEAQAMENLSSKKSLSKDAVTYGLLKGISNDLMGYYDTAWKNKLAGSPQNEWLAQQLSGTEPKGEGLASIPIPFAARPLGDMMPKDAMSSVGKMQAASNELILRLQPFLSESLDKDGTNRILQSMLQMSKSEVPSLSNERNSAIGKLIGTLRTVKRFTNASGDYSDLMNEMAKNGSNEDLNNAIQKVMNSPKASLSDTDEKFFRNLEKQYQNNYTSMPGSSLRFQDSTGKSYDVPPERRYDALKLGWKEQ